MKRSNFHRDSSGKRGLRVLLSVLFLLLPLSLAPLQTHAASIIEDTVYGLVKSGTILTMTARDTLEGVTNAAHETLKGTISSKDVLRDIMLSTKDELEHTARSLHEKANNTGTSLLASTASVGGYLDSFLCNTFNLLCEEDAVPTVIETDTTTVTTIPPAPVTTTPLEIIRTPSVSSGAGQAYVSNTYPTTYITVAATGESSALLSNVVTKDFFDTQLNAIFNSMEDGDSAASFDITTASIESLSDVADMAKAGGDLLSWNGTSWTNVATSTLGLTASSDFDSSAELAAILTDETGTGNLVFSASPTLTGTATLANASTTNFTVSGNSYLGTIRSGTWNGGTIGVPYGGTGATSLTGLLLGNGTSPFTATTTLSASYIEDAYVLNTGDSISGNLTFSGSAANVILGSNWLSGDGDDEGVFVSSTGNVGIGTTTPDTKIVVTTGGNGWQAYFGESGKRAGIWSGTGSGVNRAVFGTPDADAQIRFNIGGIDYMTIASSTGNIGIGTSTPASKLHIQGDEGSSDILAISSSTGSRLLTVTADGGVGIGTTTLTSTGCNGKLCVSGGVINLDNTQAIAWGGGTGRTSILGDKSAGTMTLSAATSFAFNTGNVGIGTTTASAKLHITGTAGSSDTFAISSSTNERLFTVTAAGYVGIGTTSPSGRLAVTDGTDAVLLNLQSGTPRIQFDDGGETRWEIDSSGGFLRFLQPGLARMVIDSSGRVGIGASAPGQALTIGNGGIEVSRTTSPFILLDYGGTNVGQFRANATSRMALTDPGGSSEFLVVNTTSGNVGIGMTGPSVALDVTGSIEYTGTITDVSDRRLKENIHQLSGNLEKLLTLEPVSFTMKDDASSTPQLGFIAQNVLEAYTEPVSYIDPDNTDYLGLDYTQLIAPTVGAVIELHEELSDLFLYGTTSASSTFSFLMDDDTDSIWSRLVTLAGSFVDGVLTTTGVRVEYLRSDYLEAREGRFSELLCVGETCVTESELKALLGGQAQPSAQPGEGSSPEDSYADPSAEQATANEDDAETADSGTDAEAADDTDVADASANDEGADDTGVDLDDGATSTIDTIDLDDSEIDEVIAPPPLQEVATPSPLAQ